jgi:hypothetical protein
MDKDKFPEELNGEIISCYFFRKSCVEIEKGLEIDHDDSHCYDRNCKKFALLIHGAQPAGSPASKAVQKLKKNGIMGLRRLLWFRCSSKQLFA